MFVVYLRCTLHLLVFRRFDDGWMYSGDAKNYSDHNISTLYCLYDGCECLFT